MRFLQGLSDLSRRKLSLREEIEEANSLDIGNEQLLYAMPQDSLGIGVDRRYYDSEGDDNKDEKHQEAKVAYPQPRLKPRRARPPPRKTRVHTTKVRALHAASLSRLKLANQNSSEVDPPTLQQGSSAEGPLTRPIFILAPSSGRPSKMLMNGDKSPLGKLQLKLLKTPPFDVVRSGPPKLAFRKSMRIVPERDGHSVPDRRLQTSDTFQGTLP